MITLLQLVGLGDNDDVLFVGTRDNGQKRMIDIDKVSPLLEPLDPKKFRHRKILYGGLNSNYKVDINPDIVFNSISDPDRCSHTLKTVQDESRNNPFAYINHPNSIPDLRQNRLFEITQNIQGLRMPKCVRCTPKARDELISIIHTNDLQLPLIISEAGTDPHNKNSFFFNDLEQACQLERFAFDGRAYYLKEFVDYRSTDNLYRKHRFFVIGTKIIPGHLIISDQWNIVDDAKAHKNLMPNIDKIIREEKQFLKKYHNNTPLALKTLSERINLDFYAIDCSIDNKGDVLLFKLDAEAHYFERTKHQSYYHQKQIDYYNKAVESMILDKMRMTIDV